MTHRPHHDPRLGGIPQPTPDNMPSIYATVLALKEAVETIGGMRNKDVGRFTTYEEFLTFTTNSNAQVTIIAADLAAHIADTGNPHSVTKAQVGLGNADNTSDLNKPISTATQTALNAKVTGPASVTDDLPAVFDGTTGKLIKQKTYAAFKTLLALVKGDVGLGNVDNTSDLNKPVSTATQTALNLKANAANPAFTGNGSITGNFDIDGSLTVGTSNAFQVQADGDVVITKDSAALFLIGASGSIYATLDGVAGTNRAVQHRTNGVLRWLVGANSVAEGGANAGSNYAIYRYTDAGAVIDAVLDFNRATGIGTFAASPVAPTPAAADNSTKLATTAHVKSAAITQVVIRNFSASGTYTPTAGMKFCIVEAVGGGGGGGGVAFHASGGAAGGGGGAGSYGRSLFTAADVGASKAIAIGAAGAAGTSAGTSGGTGGTTTFGGTLLTAPGGAGGMGTALTSSSGLARTGGDGGTSGTADAGIDGAPGMAGIAVNASIRVGGNGGSSFFGGGGLGPQFSTSAGAGNGANAEWGGGGSGGVASTTVGAVGGVGGLGLVVITEFI